MQNTAKPALANRDAQIVMLARMMHHVEIPKQPRFVADAVENVLNTPSHHRVHHGVNELYLDKNYAGVFIVWDKLFGSFIVERDDEQIRYGIVKQLGTFNLFWSVFHEWAGILKDLWAAPWRAKLMYLVGPPGWSHDGSRETSDMIRERWEKKPCQVQGTNMTSSLSAADPAEVPLPDASAKGANTASA